MENQEFLVQEQPSYLDAAKEGKSSVLRYIAGTFSVLFIWLILGGIATSVLLVFFIIVRGLDLTDVSQLILDPSILGYIPYTIMAIIGFLFLYFGIWAVVRVIHGRPLRSLVTGNSRVNWRRIGIGFAVWFLLLLVGTFMEYLIWPDTFTLNFDAAVFIPFAILALLLFPIQTTAEELFFRGYLVQAGSLINRNRFFLSIWSGVLFSLPHILNPEVATNFFVVMLTFFVLGVFLAWISLKDGTIELAIGLHAANNLFVALFVTFPESSLQTPGLFSTTQYNPTITLISEIIFCALFYLVVFVWPGTRNREVEAETSMG